MMYENSGLINWVVFKGVEDFLGKADPTKVSDPILRGLIEEFYDLRKRVANALMAPQGEQTKLDLSNKDRDQIPIDFDKDAK